MVVVRPSNPYGVGQIGQNQQGFIGAAIHAWARALPLEVYGERGTVRDYIYIEDLASGLVAALERGDVGETYNIGTGVGYDNLQVLGVIEEALAGTGGRWNLVGKEARPFDVQSNILDASKLRLRCGWTPRVGLHEGIESTYRKMIESK